MRNGGAARTTPASGDRMNPIVRVCSLLNSTGAKYLVIGGQAIILHGIIRTMEDVDILIDPSLENCSRVLAA
jgi:hypothetical protein